MERNLKGGSATVLESEACKASITDAIAKDVIGSHYDDIAQKVDVVYERLLFGAVIFTHIPSLTAGLVRREVMASNRAARSKSPSVVLRTVRSATDAELESDRN
jgi:hypothetical protein